MTSLRTASLITTQRLAELFARRRSVRVCALCVRPDSETRLARGATGSHVCEVCATLAVETLRGVA